MRHNLIQFLSLLPLLLEFSSMLEKFQLRANATSVSDPSAVPGY